jgi:hypothetical protein
MCSTLYVQYSLFLQNSNKMDFLDRFSKTTQILNFMKIGPVRAEFFNADGQTDSDMTKLIVAFRNFSDAPKKFQKRNIGHFYPLHPCDLFSLP